MGKLVDDMEAAPRKVMTLFYLVDTSGSMQGTKIGTVNSAMEEVIPLLSEVSADNDDAEIRVAIMQFSSGFSWITGDDGPKELEGLSWNDLTAGGLTDFGSALEELDKKLSREGFLKTQTGAYAPVILLLSDGAPTDDWESALKKLQENNWFKHAIKIAIDIDGGSDREVLTKFTGNVETILNAGDKNTLRKMIHKVSVRASEFQSHSKQAADVSSDTTAEQDSADIVKEVVEEVNFDVDNKIDTSNDANWGNW